MDLGPVDNIARTMMFTGKEGEWREWSAKFLARERLSGYAEALQEDPVKADVEVEHKTAEGHAVRDLNMLAYSTLIVCCKGVPFSIVNEAKTDTLPDGDAKLAWRGLKEKYQIENAASKIELKRKFAQNTLKAGQDPDE